MFAVLGASGHVGKAITEHLLQQGLPVTVVIHDPQKAADWMRQGASVAVLDIHDTEALAQTLKSAERAFLLNPPASPSLNTDQEERKTVRSILQAVSKADLKKIVVQSTYGAQEGAHCGDLGVLYEFERGAQQSSIPLCIVRAAYYMSNWLPSLALAKQEGRFPSLLPSGLKVPMVAPQDVGKLAAQLLSDPVSETGIYNIEGPEYYTTLDVAKSFSKHLSRDIAVDAVPPSDWHDYYRAHCFSEEATHSYANMTGIFVEQRYEMPTNVIKGETTLSAYFDKEI
ncbi:NmrA family NAD(P)-binding protein [Acetobacter aceti]|uniref:NmrA family transcriptional regulator n=1 Tax=Acetobacter aceti TaxID=435 RepID=A0A6S6PIU0_ACEAC|nr:NmrA family NAD(P)-binding protein [Acetobacter aceti]BCI66605.1 NmrA family transcriptional regulator [Acetobacter aceti]